MKRVLTAVVLIPLVLMLVFKAPLWMMAFVASLFGLAATAEYLGIAGRYGFSLPRRLAFALMTAFFLGTIASAIGFDEFLRGGGSVLRQPASEWMAGLAMWLTMIPLFGGPLALLAVALKEDDLRRALPSAALSMVPLFYIGVPLYALVSSQFSVGPYYVLFLLVVVWSGDIAAYYVGKNFGRHKLAPRVSPNKSWEGAAASLITATAFGILLHQNSELVLANISQLLPLEDSPRMANSGESHSLWLAGTMAMIGNVAAQIGDLVESAMKRGAGVKDSGSTLPGHGGVLDRIDALLFASPVVWGYAFLATLRFYG